MNGITEYRNEKSVILEKRYLILFLLLVLIHTGSACTSFCMNTDSGPVFGTNLDLFIPGDGTIFINQSGIHKSTYQTNINGDRKEWISKYGSITFNLAGKEFAWSGMNEAGLVISSMELRSGEYPELSIKYPLFDGNWIQYMLDNCSTIAEVVEANRSVTVIDQGFTSHYLAADSEGNCLVIEFIDGRLMQYYGDDLPVNALSNIRYDQALAAYNGKGHWWWSNPGKSIERFAACKKRNDNFAADNDVNSVNYAFETLINRVAAPHTKWNVVYDIVNREIWYRTAQSPDHKHISLKDLDFTCEAVPLMLDVNKDFKGDALSHFIPYNYEVSFQNFVILCERLKLKVTDLEARELTRYLDHFNCEPKENIPVNE